MDAALERALQKMIANWEKMKHSHEDDAADEAEQFEASFYAWIDHIRQWYTELPHKPATLEEAMLLPDVQQSMERLPIELMLNFETELELIVAGQTREEEERYD